jgi:hypothetical protein
MNWFQRHPNWTVVIAAYVPQIIVGVVVVLISSPLSPTWAVVETSRDAAFITRVISLACVGVWALKQKGRSLWWLFLVIPFGWIPYVCLTNKRNFERELWINSSKKITERVEAGKSLLYSFQPLQVEAASIYDRICPTHGIPLNDCFTAFKNALEADANIFIDAAAGSPHEPSVFVEVLEKLPAIIGRMKALPKSNVRILRNLQEFEVKALDAFVEACKLGIVWADIRELAPMLKSGETDEAIAFKTGWSRDGIRRARKEAARDCKPLEAAMRFRFTQAYKWWALASKAESAFWESGFRDLNRL